MCADAADTIIHPMGESIVENNCRILRHWRRTALGCNGLYVSWITILYRSLVSDCLSTPKARESPSAHIYPICTSSYRLEVRDNWNVQQLIMRRVIVFTRRLVFIV